MDWLTQARELERVKPSLTDCGQKFAGRWVSEKAPVDDVVGVKEVQASGDVREDPGAIFVPPKVALVVVAQSILEVSACTRP